LQISGVKFSAMDTPPKLNPPARYRDSKLIWAGAVILILGSGPLLGIIIAARLSLTPDSDPNPIAFGILAGLTFWPGIALLLAGVLTVWSRNRK
jgi:hypothetical protein